MAPVPGGILFITLNLADGDEAEPIADQIVREIRGVSRKYPCGLPFVVGPSRIVIESGEEAMDERATAKLAEEIRGLMRRLSDDYRIKDFRVSTEG